MEDSVVSRQPACGIVLRFVQDASEHDVSRWRAVVVHVQTSEEKTCADFADAVAFIARYVPIGNFVFAPTTDGGQS